MEPAGPGALSADQAGGSERGSVTPTFLVVGGMKCGTTTLSAYLGAHPDVFVSPVHEPHYFDRNLHRGLPWYLDHFNGTRGQSQVGEATAQYLYISEAAEPMARTLPDAKVIAVLRNPVDRAYSHYWHNRVRGREELSFEEAVEAEPERLRADPAERRRRSYLDQGRYAEQLRRISAYYPRSQVHVLLMDDMVRDPAVTYAAVCLFLDIDPAFRPPILGKVFNRHQAYRSVALHRLSKRLGSDLASLVRRLNGRSVPYPPMAPPTREALLERFRAPNRELTLWLDRDLSGWDR